MGRLSGLAWEIHTLAECTSPQFTGKERDAETGLDYFGARYMSAAQGRFTSPDAPFADQHAEDPQSWNLYGYVRNNPLAHVDPTGRACRLGNLTGSFCGRADWYASVDRELHGRTRFFAAASAVNEALANFEMPRVVSYFIATESTQSFVIGVGHKLEAFNKGIIGEIRSGQLSGDGLDSKIIHREQTVVQQELDKLKQSDPNAYAKAIQESNAVLNPRGIKRGLGGAAPTDAAYIAILDKLRKGLGRDLDFSRQGDREAIGNALADHIRQTGGCDLAVGIQGCR